MGKGVRCILQKKQQVDHSSKYPSHTAVEDIGCLPFLKSLNSQGSHRVENKHLTKKAGLYEDPNHSSSTVELFRFSNGYVALNTAVLMDMESVVSSAQKTKISF